MGLLDVLGLGKKKTGNPLLDALLPMLLAGGAAGGLGGLLSKFKSAGLGSKADSWVSTGANVHQALGDETVGQLAQKSGMSKDQVKGGLASMLPNLVDQLTPGGSVPSGGLGNLGQLTKGLDLGKILGGLGK
jgi:uncharacterized protein YidB (DUF937 family)